MPNIILCKFCIYWWLGATLIPFSAWSDTSLLRTREEHAQSRRWRVMGILSKLLGVPELLLQSFCSLTVSLIHEDLKTNGLEARRWPGLALGVPSALWDLCGCFCDTPQKHLPRHQRKLQREMIPFFTWCGKRAGESPRYWEESFKHASQAPLSVCCIYSFLCLPPQRSRYFLLVTATKWLSVWGKIPLNLGDVESAWEQKNRKVSERFRRWHRD